MYSVVLAAMLTTGPAQAPAWGFGCHGCCGGYNAFSCCGGYSCCGGWSSCCGGHSCCGGYSCCGGGWYSGCCGGGYTAGYNYPAYWGCCGSASAFGCCGYSSCCGGYGWGGYSCCGGGWYRSSSGWVPAYTTCCGGTVVAPGTPAPPTMPKLPEPKEKQSATAPAPATVVLKAPMDVRITVNGQPTERQSAEQVFTTPDLQPGKTYSYDFRAEATRDGKTVTRTQTVIVKAGQESRADFGDLMAAGAPAHVTITAPADARLTVDGAEVPGSARTFSTPTLEAGRTFYYTVTAEMTREGRKVSDSRRVLVSAGQDVSVEFTEAGVATAGK